MLWIWAGPNHLTLVQHDHLHRVLVNTSHHSYNSTSPTPPYTSQPLTPHTSTQPLLTPHTLNPTPSLTPHTLLPLVHACPTCLTRRAAAIPRSAWPLLAGRQCRVHSYRATSSPLLSSPTYTEYPKLLVPASHNTGQVYCMLHTPTSTVLYEMCIWQGCSPISFPLCRFATASLVPSSLFLGVRLGLPLLAGDPPCAERDRTGEPLGVSRINAGEEPSLPTTNPSASTYEQTTPLETPNTLCALLADLLAWTALSPSAAALRAV